MSENELKLPSGCLCYQCPNYEKCLAVSKKVFSVATENVERSQQGQPILKEFEKLVKDDPLKFVCSYGGFLLGVAFSEWLKKNYSPRRRRFNKLEGEQE